MVVHYKPNREQSFEAHGETFEVGDILIEGYAKSIGRNVRFIGIGFKPEVHGNIAVAVTGKTEDGLSRMATERIEKIETLGAETDIETG